MRIKSVAENRADNTQSRLNMTALGKHFNISATRANHILSELGWIKKDSEGWLVTELGKRLGGLQSKHNISHVPYVHWPASILANPKLIASMQGTKGIMPTPSQDATQIHDKDEVDYRKKYEAKYRAEDGHYVRSKAELSIDNWLYTHRVVHAYEKKLPIGEVLYSDFYIPTGKVYIEYFGIESDPKYLARKKEKLEIYSKKGYPLIELLDKDVRNLDDVLPRELLKYRVEID
jgi:hypothetical protein